MKKYILVFILFFVCFSSNLAFAKDNDVEQETKELAKIQLILEKAVIAINNIANKVIEQQNFKNSMDKRIVNKLVPWGHDKMYYEERKIDTIVVHSVYDALGQNPYDSDGVMYEFAVYDVCSHYLISREGIIYRMVKDNDLAWHAGRSQLFDGRTSVNKFSIGIELIQHEKEEANDIQYKTLVDLIKYLQLDYDIKNITGHTNVSLTKKTDPWNFDWKKFNTVFDSQN